jgi:hypothetical protein
MAGVDIARATIVARHESGHLIVARSYGFSTGDIKLTTEEGGAVVELQPSVPTVDKIVEYLEKRIVVLYAGSLAESLVQKKVDGPKAIKFLNSTAKNDYAKVRELARVLAGIAHPNVGRDEFEKALADNDSRLFNDAAKLIEGNYDVIFDLTQFFARTYVRSKANPFVLTGKEVDTFLADKKIKNITEVIDNS